MATTEKYTTVIELNSEQAKRELDELRRKVEGWKSDLKEAQEKKMGKSFIASIRKELREAEKELKKYDNEVARTIDTMNDLESASVERLEEAQKNLKRLASEVPRDSAFFQQLNDQLDMVTQELENVKATKAFELLQQQASGATKTAEQLKAELEFIRQTADNAETASVKQLQLAEKTAQNIKDSAQKGSDEWNQASTGLETVRTRLTAIEQEERKVVSTIERYEQEVRNANKSVEVTQRETELVNQTLAKLSSASVRDIEYSIRILNEQLRDTERTGGNVEQLTEKLKQLNEELKKVQDMQKPDKDEGNIFTRMIDGLNKNWGAITQIFGAVTGLSATIRSAVNDFAFMEEEMADVRKYTGMTMDQVRELNEVFKTMDTRTSREELNQMAGAAGRLGITSKQGVLDFVEAANMISVALGDDLGEGAVDQIGKLAMAFGEDDNLGLRGAMLATGSAINELAQNSSAKAGFLVDFTARVAGFGKQLGLTQAQIMGFGAVMDENLLRDEMAATAFGNMLTKMQTDTEKFARIAGQSVEDFMKLLNEDANAAILAVADSLKRQDPQTMMKMLDDMGLDGSRAVGVLSTLADKIDDVRKRQELATDAYKEATSVESEYKVMNDTVEARLEKVKKAFKEMTVQLGEKLLPVVRFTISGAGLLAKGLYALTEFVSNNWRSIVTLTSGLIAYQVAVSMAIIKEKAHAAAIAVSNGFIKTRIALTKAWGVAMTAVGLVYDLLTGKIKFATFVQQMHNKVVMANPYVAAAAAVMTLVAAIVSLIGRTGEMTRAQKALHEVALEAENDIAGEKAELESLVETARNKALTDEIRKEAIRKLQEKYPDYLSNLSLEKINTEEATTAIDNLTDALMAEAKARILVQRIKEAEDEKAKLNEEYFSGISGLWNSLTAQFAAMTNTVLDGAERIQHTLQGLSTGSFSGWNEPTWITENGYVTDPVQVQLNRYGAAVREVQGEIDALNAELRETVRHQAELRTNKPAVVDTGDGTDANSQYRSEAEIKKELAEQRKRLAALRREEAEEKKVLKEMENAAKAESDAAIAAKTHEYAMGRISYRQYIEDMAQLQREGLEKRRDVYLQGSAEYEKLNRQVEELSFKGSQQVNQMKLEDLRRCMLLQQIEIETQAAKGEISEAERQERLRLLNETYLADKVELYKEGSLERMNAEWELQEAEQRNQLERELHYQQELDKVRTQYLWQSDERTKALALENLDELHSRLLISEKEYQEAKLAIEAQYSGYETGSERDQRVASNAVKVATDKAKQQNDGKSGASVPFASDIMLYQSTMEQLKQMYQSDELTHAQYLAAKHQATADFCKSLAEQMQAAYNSVNQVMSAASSYFSAQQEYETAQVQKKYEKQIEAAGNNQQKVKKLQEKQQKEEAAIKSKYAKRAAAIQMAQAVAQTAISAINAYSSAAAIPVVGHVLAPVAAAMAIAAGMLQIATIKKQQQAQEAGYYEGGFTGGRQYRKEAGVVHEGEFVANHQAVQNPAVLPFLNFLDQAQRNNTVGSLSMADVSHSMGAGGTAQVVAPIVNVQTDNDELREEVAQLREVNTMLIDRLSDPIEATMSMQDFDRDYKRYQQLLKNK